VPAAVGIAAPTGLRPARTRPYDPGVDHRRSQEPGPGHRAAADPGRRIGVALAVLVLSLAALAALALAAADPGFAVALFPQWLTGSTAPGRMLQVLGVAALAVPTTAAVVAGLRGAHRAAGWCAVLAVLAFLPAIVAVERGATRVRHAQREDAPVVEQCVEHSGGETRCPGG
jgi:hypothetical protein